MTERRLEYAWQTDQGCVRKHNEDSVSVHSDRRLAIVADGIGGASAGEVASRLAVHVVADCFKDLASPPETIDEASSLIRKAVGEANRTIWDTSRRSSSYSGMGTTVVAGFAGLDWMVFAHVGDSRLYLLRERELHQLTRDHSLIQEVVDQGFFQSMKDARRYGINDNILTRGLGSNNVVSVELGEVDLLPGDMFLFCTDGLSGMVPDRVLRKELLVPGRGLDDHCAALVKRALDNGGLDNVTVVLMQVY